MAREIIGVRDGIQFFVGQDTPTTPTTTNTATMTPRVAQPTTGTTNVTAPVTQPTTTPSFGVAQGTTTTPTTRDVVPAPQPTMPSPTAPTQLEEFTVSSTSNLEAERKRIEDEYKRQLAEVQKQQKDAEARQAEFTKQQEATLGKVEQISTPFRADLEKAERNRLFVDENFQANQNLIRELDTLLTQSNNMMRQLRASKIPGLAGLSQSPRAIQAMQDVSARVGVIEAVMSARNGQIAQANNLIDRSINAVNADRRDQLSYYQTVYDFYQNQKDEEGKKLYQLNQEEKSWINRQIGLLEQDLERSQRTADYVKELMINPETAKYMADAGVTLNDSVEVIQQKMAKQSAIEMRRQEAKVNQKEAFEAGIQSPFYNKGGTIIRTADGYAFESPEEFQKMTGMSLAQAEASGMIEGFDAFSLLERDQVMALMKEFPDARITPADSLEVAQDKILRSPTYQKSVRVGGGGGGGTSIDTQTEVQRYINSLISQAGGVTDANRYELWDKVATELGDMAGEFDPLLWKNFHPEGIKGYNKYVKGETSSTGLNADFQKMIQQELTGINQQ